MTTFYLDLDRTLFRTERVADLYAAIERLYPENTAIKDGYTKREGYYVYAHKDADDPTYYHDIARQLQNAGLDAEEVFTRLRNTVGDGRFEYVGVRKLVQALQARGRVVVLTYGEDLYQRGKARLCPSLEGVEIITLIGSKAEYLNEYAAPGDWIVDDKPLIGLKPGIRSILVKHDDTVPADAHSLSEVLAIVQGSQ